MKTNKSVFKTLSSFPARGALERRASTNQGRTGTPPDYNKIQESQRNNMRILPVEQPQSNPFQEYLPNSYQNGTFHDRQVVNPNPQTTGTANLRALLGLPADPASDAIWDERFAAGTHTMEHASAALRKKMDPNSPMHITNPGSFTPSYIMPAEDPAAKARARLGLSADPESDAIWRNRFAEGTHTQDQMLEALRGKAGPLQSRAADLIAMQYDPQESALQREIERIARERDYATGVNERYGSIYDQKLASISDQLLQQLGGVTDRVGGLYSDAQGQVQQAYQGAQGAMQGASEDVLADLAAQMEMLGLQEAAPDPNAEITQQTADSNARFGVSGAAGVSNLARLGFDLTGLSAQAEGDSAREWAQNRGNLANQVMAAISGIQRDAFEGITDTQGQISDLVGQRGADLRTTLADLEDMQYERERQEALDELYRRVQENTMNIQNEQLGLSKEEFAFNKQITLQNLEMEKRQLEASIAAANSPAAQLQAELELAKVQAEINRINSDIALNEAKAQGVDAEKLRLGGQEGVQYYANNVIGDPQLYTRFLEMLQDARLRGDTMGTPEAQSFSALIEEMPPELQMIYTTAYNIYKKDYAGYAGQ